MKFKKEPNGRFATIYIRKGEEKKLWEGLPELYRISLNVYP